MKGLDGNFDEGTYGGSPLPRLVGGRCLPWTPAEEEFLKENAATMSQAEIARKLNRTVGSVRAKASHYGAPGIKCGEVHHRARFSNEIVEQARELRKSGWKFVEIAKLVGASPFTVPGWCNKIIRNKMTS